MNELETIDISLQGHLDRKSIAELDRLLQEIDMKIEYAEKMMKNTRYDTNALQKHFLALHRTKATIKNTITQKREEQHQRDCPKNSWIDEELARKDLFAYLNEISTCPYCNETFTGNPSDKEKARKKHINDCHPGRKPKDLE